MPSDMDDFVNRRRTILGRNQFGGEGYRSGAPTLYINFGGDLRSAPMPRCSTTRPERRDRDRARQHHHCPTLHCNRGQVESEHTVVGERLAMHATITSARAAMVRPSPKGADNGVTKEPKVLA